MSDIKARESLKKGINNFVMLEVEKNTSIILKMGNACLLGGDATNTNEVSFPASRSERSTSIFQSVSHEFHTPDREATSFRF